MVGEVGVAVVGGGGDGVDAFGEGGCWFGCARPVTFVISPISISFH